MSACRRRHAAHSSILSPRIIGAIETARRPKATTRAKIGAPEFEKGEKTDFSTFLFCYRIVTEWTKSSQNLLRAELRRL
jgi:hypothetical protein